MVFEDDETALKRALALYMIVNRPGNKSKDPIGEADALIKTDFNMIRFRKDRKKECVGPGTVFVVHKRRDMR